MDNSLDSTPPSQDVSTGDDMLPQSSTAPSSTEAKTEQLEETQTNFTPAQLEENVRSFLTPDSVRDFTKRTIREKLAENFGVSVDVMDAQKSEINAIVAKVVDEITSDIGVTSVKSEQASEEATNGNSVRGKRKSEEPPSNVKAKKAKIESEKSDENDSDEDASEGSDGESSSEEEAPRRKPKAKAKVGVKAAQSRLMSRSTFMETAKPFDCRIGELEFKLEPRVFSTGSCGWYWGGKFPMPVGEQEVTCTIGLNCAVVGSKMWSEGKKKR